MPGLKSRRPRDVRLVPESHLLMPLKSCILYSQQNGPLHGYHPVKLALTCRESFHWGKMKMSTRLQGAILVQIKRMRASCRGAGDLALGAGDMKHIFSCAIPPSSPECAFFTQKSTCSCFKEKQKDVAPKLGGLVYVCLYGYGYVVMRWGDRVCTNSLGMKVKSYVLVCLPAFK